MGLVSKIRVEGMDVQIPGHSTQLTQDARNDSRSRQPAHHASSGRCSRPAARDDE
jgi:hypothetical protein